MGMGGERLADDAALRVRSWRHGVRKQASRNDSKSKRTLGPKAHY
jgi:hypothetical protein